MRLKLEKERLKLGSSKVMVDDENSKGDGLRHPNIPKQRQISKLL